ncbi:MAG: 3-phenylpropionate/trans-cinnamate dioxygenase ferredoxin subunit [Oceanicoccus sp.]|jgi:3-phenylpropionate/trans-cinnamate dioxygenase ferredoxin subunit
MSEQHFQRAAKASDIAQGKTLCVEIDNIEILICHSKEGFYAVNNMCSHADEKLSLGKLKDCRILCPLHGAAFDIRNGEALSKPARDPITSYPLKLEGDSILVALN